MLVFCFFQRQLRLADAKQVEAKAARIKDWVTNKLRELEEQNQHLKVRKVNRQIARMEQPFQGHFCSRSKMPPLSGHQPQPCFYCTYNAGDKEIVFMHMNKTHLEEVIARVGQVEVKAEPVDFAHDSKTEPQDFLEDNVTDIAEPCEVADFDDSDHVMRMGKMSLTPSRPQVVNLRSKVGIGLRQRSGRCTFQEDTIQRGEKSYRD